MKNIILLTMICLGSNYCAIGSSIPEIYDLRGFIKSTPVPITIIQGDKDYIDPNARPWNKIFNNSNYITIKENASHKS